MDLENYTKLANMFCAHVHHFWGINKTSVNVSPMALEHSNHLPTCLSPSLVLNSRCSKMTPMVLKSCPKIIQGAPKWPQMIPMVPKSEPKIVQGLQNHPIGRPKWTWNHQIWLKMVNATNVHDYPKLIQKSLNLYEILIQASPLSILLCKPSIEIIITLASHARPGGMRVAVK